MSEPKAKILAVDDENDILLIVKTALESEGYSVETASSGEDAVARAPSFAPDILLLDLMMPGMDGMATLEKLRKTPPTELTPAIMLTGVSDRDTILNALNKGIAHYIVKPFDCDDLLQKVEQVLKEYTKY